MNKLIVIGTVKGGAGKTTLLTHLAALAERKGQQVLIVDCDPTGASKIWCGLRKSKNIDVLHYGADKDLSRQLEILRDQYQDRLILVDCGGFDSRAMRTSVTSSVTDMVIIPSKTSALDLVVARPFILETVKALSGKRAVLRGCMSEADARPNMAGKILAAKGVFEQFGVTTLDCFVYRREAYKDYFLQGGDALSHDKKALNDIELIWNEIKELLVCQ